MEFLALKVAAFGQFSTSMIKNFKIFLHEIMVHRPFKVSSLNPTINFM
jgi:hypothetical protein